MCPTIEHYSQSQLDNFCFIALAIILWSLVHFCGCDKYLEKEPCGVEMGSLDLTVRNHRPSLWGSQSRSLRQLVTPQSRAERNEYVPTPLLTFFTLTQPRTQIQGWRHPPWGGSSHVNPHS